MTSPQASRLGADGVISGNHVDSKRRYRNFNLVRCDAVDAFHPVEDFR